jgi:hypothetical protein
VELLQAGSATGFELILLAKAVIIGKLLGPREESRPCAVVVRECAAGTTGLLVAALWTRATIVIRRE